MARRLPPLNALRAFEASARHGSFVAAASELRVSAAAVSQQVRRLEQYLDTPLFQRLARGLTLTEQGRDYLPELSAGFDLLGESTARVRTKRADGVLTLTTLAAFANGWLLPRMHRFRERAPRVDVVLRTSRQVMDFRRDAIDLAIRFAPSPGRGPQFSDSIVLIGAAVAGLGIAIGRSPHVAPLLARGQLVRVTQETWMAPWSYYLMAPAAHFRRPIVRSFVDWAMEEARSST